MPRIGESHRHMISASAPTDPLDVDDGVGVQSHSVRATDSFESPKEQAARKIQAWMRGHAVRKATVSRAAINQFLRGGLGALKSSYGGPIDLDSLSKTLAREILEFAEDKTPFLGHGKRLLAGAKGYAFPIFGANHRSAITEFVMSPVGLWAKKSEDGRGIELELVGAELANGTYKRVFESKVIQVDLASLRHEVSIGDATLVAANPGCTEQVLDGLHAIRINFTDAELANPKLRLAGLLAHAGRHHAGEMEARDFRYPGDLQKLGPALSLQQKAQALADVAETLEILHAKRLVHRDVKPKNILVSKDARGHLADFDFTRQQGIDLEIADYVYWDSLSCLGCVTRLTDIYGLAHSAAQLFFKVGFQRLTGEQLHTKADDCMMEIMKPGLVALGIGDDCRFGPETVLAKLNDLLFLGALTQAQFDVARDLSRQLENLATLRDIIAGVFDADAAMLPYLASNLDIDTKLGRGDETHFEEAVSQLRAQFPQYDKFSSELRRIAANWPMRT